MQFGDDPGRRVLLPRDKCRSSTLIILQWTHTPVHHSILWFQFCLFNLFCLVMVNNLERIVYRVPTAAVITCNARSRSWHSRAISVQARDWLANWRFVQIWFSFMSSLQVSIFLSFFYSCNVTSIRLPAFVTF